MKAVVIEKPGCVELEDVPDPVPQSGEVLLRPKAGGVCGTDVHILEGQFIGQYPVIPCHEFSAEVVEVGDDVGALRVGDSVAVDPNIRCGQCSRCRSGEINLCENYQAVGVTRPGGFAERVCVPVKNVHRFSRCEYAAAAFAEPLACVLYGQSRLRVTPGSKVIVWGAGAIGLLHVQVCAKLRGVDITVVDKDAKRVEKARSLGAGNGFVSDDFIDEALKDQNPSGWDIAVEATGSSSALQQLFLHLRSGGQALVFGVYPQEDHLLLKAFDVFLNDWSIYGSFTYRHEFAQAVQLLASKRIDVDSVIDLTVPLDDVPAVLERLAEGERLGKVQVTM